MQVTASPARTLIPLLMFAFATVLAAANCKPSPEVVIYRHKGGEVRLPVELALTEHERSRGLMYRRDLPAGSGMLFVFPESAEHPFWMKNTPLALDMIFIGDDMRIVGIVASTLPFSTKSVGVDGKSRYVLETHAGFAAQSGITAGDRVELRNVPSGAARP